VDVQAAATRMMRRAQWFFISFPIVESGCGHLRGYRRDSSIVCTKLVGFDVVLLSMALAVGALSEEVMVMITATTVATTARSSKCLVVQELG